MKKSYLKVFILIIFFIFFYSFIYYKIGTKKDIISFNKIEAIVVLTGSKGRIPLAKKIYLKDKNLYLIISGVNSKINKNHLKKIFGLSRFKNIIIENRSKNTIQNAIETKKIIEKLGIKSILLITSSIHLPRAYIIFKFILGNEYKIYKIPVKENFSFFKILKENFKLLYFFVLYFFNF